MTNKHTEGHKMSREETLAAWAVILVSAAVFFATAWSAADNLLKALVIIADLSLSGSLLARITRAEGWHGLVMLRSQKGFSTMEHFATHHTKAVREIADFGMSLSYGIPFAAYLYGRQPMRLAVHALLLTGFYWWLQGMPSANAFLSQYTILIGALGGLLGLGVVSLAASTISILTVKTAPAAVAPVVPGITLPFWEGLIAIGIVAAVHELAHGVLARAEKLPVLSSGIILFGFLPIGAFVEPNEKKFARLPIEKKRRILVVGTTSNFLFFLVFLGLFFAASTAIPSVLDGVSVTAVHSNSTLAGVLAAGDVISRVNGEAASADKLTTAVITGREMQLETEGGRQARVGVSQLVVSEVTENSPAMGVLERNDVIAAVDGVRVRTTGELRRELQSKTDGAQVTISTGSGTNKTLVPDENKRLGISVLQAPAFAYENRPAAGMALAYQFLVFLLGVLGLTAFLNFALAVVNIIPIFTTDGYRIAYEELVHVLGKKGEPLARKITLVLSISMLALLLINLARWFKFF